MDSRTRDLACLDPWAESLERSLRRRNLRSPLQPWIHERARADLADERIWLDSLERSRTRRRAAERNGDLLVGRRKASLAALVAVTAPPAATLAGAGLGAAPASAAAVRLLKRGSHGAAVQRLQRLLGISADGIFGPATARAVRSFQRGHGLAVDGVVGPATWAALGGGRAASRHVASLRGRAGGYNHLHLPSLRVRELQRLLGIPADGIYGPQTDRAVRRFQARAGLLVDGLPGPQTFAALRGRHGARHHFSRVAYRSGGGVRTLQRLLGVPADGVFGPQTRRAVIAFQRRHGLTADGIVGPATWAALGVRSSTVLKMRGSSRSSHTGGSGVVARVIAAANRIATMPYRYGGGHGSWTDSGYDCSGSVSYALHGGGLLSAPLDSTALESYGRPGPGRHITIYANAGHAFMVVDGRRFDTSAMSQTGSRWTSTMRSTAGYVARHPAGL